MSSSIAVALSLLGCAALLSDCLRADNGAQTRPCRSDNDCLVGGVPGRCLAQGVCAFADQSCPSGLRVAFHPLASAGVCLPPSAGDGAPPGDDASPPPPILDGLVLPDDSGADRTVLPLDAATCGAQGGLCCATAPACPSSKLVCLENKTCSCVSHLVAGGDAQCAVHPSGAVSCWGSNSAGQIAMPPSAAVISLPTRTPLLTVVARGLALGGAHGCAISKLSSQLLCWGDNSVGQLGRSGAGEAKPLAVALPAPPKRVAAGRLHTCVISAKDEVYCWGDNQKGQLSDAVTDTTTNVPTRVASLLAPASIITAGAAHSCVATASSVFCWGENGKGQLGTGNFGKSSGVEQTTKLGAVQQLSAGANHTCALTGGSIYCWGEGSQGQTGAGPAVGALATPALVVIPGQLKASRIVSGDNHSCAIVGGGNVYCWGLNDFGQVGLPSTVVALRPVPVLGVKGAVDLSLGATHSCALTLGGTVVCWGNNKKGQLGQPNVAPGAATKPAVGCF